MIDFFFFRLISIVRTNAFLGPAKLGRYYFVKNLIFYQLNPEYC